MRKPALSSPPASSSEAPSADHTLELAEAQRRRAVAANRTGRPDRAFRALARALDILDRRVVPHPGTPDDPAVRIRVNVLITSALTEFLAHGLEPAERAMAEVRELIDGLDGGEAGLLESRWHFQYAGILGQAGDLSTALSHLATVDSSLDAFTPAERGAVRLTHAMLLTELGHPSEAVRIFREAAAGAAELGDAALQAAAEHDAAYAAYLMGDLPAALAGMAAVGEGRGAITSPELDRALVLIDAGLTADAVAALDNALRATSRSAWRVRAEILLSLSRVHRWSGRGELARAEAARARALYRRHGALAWEANAHLLLLQIALDGGRATPGMAADAEQLAAAAYLFGSMTLADRARTVAAEVHARRGEWEAARLQLAESSGTTNRSLQGDLHRIHVEATVQSGLGEVGKARRLLTRGSRLLAAGQQGSASLDLRAAVALHGIRLADLDLELALPQGAHTTLKSLERWRSATDRIPRVRPSSDAELARLSEQLRSTRDRMRREEATDAIAAIQEQASALQQEIRERDWARARAETSDEASESSLASALELLRSSGRGALWLFPLRGRLMGVGVVGGRARLRDLLPLAEAVELAERARADLRVLGTHQLGPFHGAVLSSLTADLTRLDAALIRPWGFASDGLVLIPCREVGGMPWALAPSLAGRPLTVARSLGGWARRTGESADPTLHVSVGPRLDRAAEEAAAVARTWGQGNVEIASPATASGLVHAVTAADIVHVAAHGTHEPQSPLFSSIELDDGPVFAHEFQPHGIRAQHVVLSACDVGTATVRPGEESLGLAASMLSLGAASVVAAVSAVPDDVACEVMTAHHKHLAAGRPTDEALALAIAASDPIAAAFHSMGSQWRFATPTR